MNDLIAFNDKNADREMPFFGQEILEQAAKKGPLTDKAYLDALAKDHELMRAKGIDAVLAKHKLDALVVLTNGPAHLTDLVNGDSFSGSSSSPAAVAGYPTITLPAGLGQRPAGRHLVHRQGLERAGAHQARPTASSRRSACARRRACCRRRRSARTGPVRGGPGDRSDRN